MVIIIDIFGDSEPERTSDDTSEVLTDQMKEEILYDIARRAPQPQLIPITTKIGLSS